MVLLAIADNADDFGFAFPSYETIAQKARCSTRTAMRHVDELETHGWLKVGRKLNGRGNVYFVNLEKLGVSVSPKARKSPLFTHLQKVAGDKLSLIFLPRPIGDSAKISSDNPQAQQVTKRHAHVTGTPSNGDTSSHTNPEPSEQPPLQPSAEVKYTPTPQGGVEFPQWGKTVTSEQAKAFLVLHDTLKFELENVPLGLHGTRFVPLRAGQWDFDVAFRDMRLDELRTVAGTTTMFINCCDPPGSRAGFDRYHTRIERIAAKAFGWPRGTKIRFAVRHNNAINNPAA